ncbi:hypothetical protein NE237_006196 [Protea cynaroides]|uniref:Protein kinase domain-containing protein n=1 Tax=Protea cynaroides TaxID=273540 RepID=A0A9Q0KM14_9MAGN|nr:hypothetical protein NE237_006196 [Protea cynaroides]
MSSISLPFNAFIVVAFPIFLVILNQFSHVSGIPDREFCPQSNFCGKVNISYPFFNYSTDHWLHCGLESLLCKNGSIPVLFHIGDDNNDISIYEVQSIDYSNMEILAHDRRFTGDVRNDPHKCNALFNNFTMPPIFGSLSAELISPNLTLRVCKRHQELNDSVGKDCKVEVLPDADTTPAPQPGSDNSSYDCKVVHLPVDVPPSKFHGPIDPVSQLFTPGFRLRWSFPQPCHQCQKNGTICLHDHRANEQFKCSDKKNRWGHREGVNSKKTKVITAIVAGVGGILITCFIFFLIYYRHRCSGILFGLPKKRTPSSSLTPLSASIASCYGIHLFTYKELEEATDNFNSKQELGDGGFGTVYYGKLRNGLEVAVKRLYENNCKRVKQFMNEVGILARLRHPNLVTLCGCTSRHSRELLLVYEFIPNGTVADHLHGDRTESGSLPWPTRMSIAIETAQALTYLHASDIIHRDVKTNNILLDQNFHVKVADFGLSRLGLQATLIHSITSTTGLQKSAMYIALGWF